MSIATTVARTLVFICAATLFLLASEAADARWVSWLVAAVAVCADAAIFLSSGARGRELIRSTSITATVWLGVAVVLSRPSLDHIPQNAAYVAALLVLATLGMIVLPRTQAIWAWVIAALLATGLALNMSSGVISNGPAPTLGVLALFLTGGSLGALGYYLRGAIAHRRGWKHVVSRVALIAVAVGFSVAVSSFAAAGVGQYEANKRAVERGSARILLASRLSTALSTRFPESAFAAPTPALTRELSHLAGLGDVGLTIYDAQNHRVGLAVRQTTRLKSTLPSGTPQPNTGTEYFEVFAPVAVMRNELDAITAAGEMVVATVDDVVARSSLGGLPPLAVPLGIHDETARLAWANAVATSTADVAWQAIPDSPRFRLVVSERTGDWADWDIETAEDIGRGLGRGLAPWLFLAFLLPCTLTLFALERRDATRAKLVAAEERSRLNRDAHDRVYNRLTALANRLAAAEPADAATPTPADEIRRTVGDLQSILGDSNAPVARSAADAAGVLLADICADVGRTWSMTVALEGADVLLGADPRLGWELACIVEEALTNAGRHGQATHATVNLTREGTTLVLSIHDDGSGIAEPLDERALPATASGMRGMSDRTLALGGEFAVTTGTGGVTVTARIPLPRA